VTPLLYRFQALDTVAGLSSARSTSLPRHRGAGPDEPGPGAEMTLRLDPSGDSRSLCGSRSCDGHRVKNKGVGSVCPQLAATAMQSSQRHPIHFGSDVPAQDPLKPEVVSQLFSICPPPGSSSRPARSSVSSSKATRLPRRRATFPRRIADDPGAEDLARTMVFKTFVRTGSDLTAPSGGLLKGRIQRRGAFVAGHARGRSV